MAIDNYSQSSTPNPQGDNSSWLDFQAECKMQGCTNTAVRMVAISYLQKERQKQQRGVSLTLEGILFPQQASLRELSNASCSLNEESVYGRILESLHEEINASR
jgi:hypothetical protein